MDQVVVFLLQMEALFSFLGAFRQELPSLRKAIAAQDPGPLEPKP
jgi:hypothetical protein